MNPTNNTATPSTKPTINEPLSPNTPSTQNPTPPEQAARASSPLKVATFPSIAVEEPSTHALLPTHHPATDQRPHHTWLVPHSAQDQKHAWHNQSFGMDQRVARNEWGFHSASVSRTHSPSAGQ